VIRFSASLVVVALGLLVAGGVTSKLLLVYVAIAVSVIALAFLIIGSILDRGEPRASSPAQAPGDRLDQPSAGGPDQAPADDREEAAAGRPDSVAAGVPGGDLTSLTGRPDWLDGPVAGAPGEAPMARPDAAPPGRPRETPAARPGPAPAGWADQAQQAGAATANQYARPDTPPPGPSDTSSPTGTSSPSDTSSPTGTSSAVDTTGPEDTGNIKDTGVDTGGAGTVAGARFADQPVRVVPGVPRYHRSDCILIRFMGDSDLQKMPVEAAKENGCTPCRACHTDGQETG
jgi:hypothetical protein